MATIDEWFDRTGMTIGEVADTPQRRDKVKRLFYTWKDCFALRMTNIKATDLVEHSIDLQPGARPVRAKLPRYTHRERDFANRMIPEMEEAGILVKMSSDWGARTKFPPKS
jgi:hypothetical protein